MNFKLLAISVLIALAITALAILIQYMAVNIPIIAIICIVGSVVAIIYVVLNNEFKNK